MVQFFARIHARWQCWEPWSAQSYVPVSPFLCCRACHSIGIHCSILLDHRLYWILTLRSARRCFVFDAYSVASWSQVKSPRATSSRFGVAFTGRALNDDVFPLCVTSCNYCNWPSSPPVVESIEEHLVGSPGLEGSLPKATAVVFVFSPTHSITPPSPSSLCARGTQSTTAHNTTASK